MTAVYISFGVALGGLLLVHIAAHLLGWYEDPAPAQRPYVALAASVPLVEVPDDRPMWPTPAPDLDDLTRPLTLRELNRTPALLWAEVVGHTGVLA